MAAIATKKRNGDLGVQLQFPTVFAEAYNEMDIPMEYYPEEESQPSQYTSDDYMAQLHQHRMEESHRLANASVQSKINSDYRASHSHAGYYGMPKPVLGQRQYANPSCGNQADVYSNRNVDWNVGTMSGGVLYTKQAQQWGRQQLHNRIGQLNAIDMSKQAFMGNMPLAEDISQESSTFGSKGKLELVQILQGIMNGVLERDFSAFSFKDVSKFVRLLLRWAVSADITELNEVFDFINTILQEIRGYGQQQGIAGNPAQFSYMNGMADLFEKIRDYLIGMIDGVNLSLKNRKLLSANLVKSIGLLKLDVSLGQLNALMNPPQRIIPPRSNQPPNQPPYYPDNRVSIHILRHLPR